MAQWLGSFANGTNGREAGHNGVTRADITIPSSSASSMVAVAHSVKSASTFHAFSPNSVAERVDFGTNDIWARKDVARIVSMLQSTNSGSVAEKSVSSAAQSEDVPDALLLAERVIARHERRVARFHLFLDFLMIALAAAIAVGACLVASI